jgi:hypothetical protein
MFSPFKTFVLPFRIIYACNSVEKRRKKHIRKKGGLA